MITLVVKGNSFQATKAAMDRGIPAALAPYQCQSVETFLECRPEDQEKIFQWFAEPVASEPGKGFPIGSLLFYSENGKIPLTEPA